MTESTSNLGDIFGTRRDSEDVAIVAVDSGGSEHQWTFAKIEQGAQAVAHFLQAERIEPGSRVGIFAVNSVEYLLAYFGIMRHGCICVPINTKQPPDVVEYICEDAGIELAFVDKGAKALVPDSVRLVDLDAMSIADGHYKTADTDSEAAALILYTSGSTGRPKGVVLSHRSQLSMIEAITGGAENAVFADQCGIVVAPMFHMNALVFIGAFLYGGGSIVLMSKFNARTFAGAIERHKVNVITGVPTMIAILRKEWPTLDDPDLASVNTVYIGSAPVTEAIVEQSLEMMPNAKVLNSYGTTETGGGLFGSHPDGIERPPTSVGYPLPSANLRLEGGAKEGVLIVKSPTAMTEYLNLPELTAARMKDGWFNTGDLFFVDEQGFFYFAGRSDDMFICSGENIYPGEVEKAIEAHRDVTQAAVVPVEDDIRGKMPVAFVASSNPGLTVKDVQEHVKATAAPYLYPRRVWFMGAIPLAGTGKVDKQNLAQTASRLMEEEQQTAC